VSENLAGLADLLERLPAELARQRHIKLPPTEQDKVRFLEAARDVLATDMEVKRRLKDAGLLSVRIDMPARKAALIAEIWRALPRVNKDGLPIGDGKAEKAEAEARARILLAAVAIVKGLEGVDSRETLLSATLLLRESELEIKALKSKAWGGRRTDGRAISRSAVEWAQRTADEWRKRNPRRPKTEGASWVFNRARKEGRTRCRKVATYRAWLYRNRVTI
jgi:hypothetical protein